MKQGVNRVTLVGNQTVTLNYRDVYWAFFSIIPSISIHFFRLFCLNFKLTPIRAYTQNVLR